LIAYVCAQFTDRDVWLTCREELRSFYESIGFERAGDMITLHKEAA